MSGLWSQPCYEAPGDILVENVKVQWLTSGEWDCPLENGPKLAMGQLDISLKKHIRVEPVVNLMACCIKHIKLLLVLNKKARRI